MRSCGELRVAGRDLNDATGCDELVRVMVDKASTFEGLHVLSMQFFEATFYLNTCDSY